MQRTPIVFSALALALVAASATQAVNVNRGYVAGKFMLSIGNSDAGWIHSAEGGGATSDVVTEKVGADGISRKHIGKPKYEDITIQLVPTGDSSPLYDWIKASLDRNYMRKSGEIQFADYKRQTRTVREFKDALLTEIAFPAADGAAKDPAYLTVKFAPEMTRHKGGGEKVEQPTDMKQKMWLPSNFRLSIEGLEQESQKVSKVDSFTIKQTAVTDDIGDSRDYQKEPAKLEFPNLTLHFPTGSTPGIQEWAESSIVGGKEDKRTGLLEVLDEDGRPVYSLTFEGLGVHRFSPLSSGATEEDCGCTKDDSNPPDAELGLYVENIKFHPGQADRTVLEKLFGQSRGGTGKWRGFGKEAARGIASEKPKPDKK